MFKMRCEGDLLMADGRAENDIVERADNICDEHRLLERESTCDDTAEGGGGHRCTF